MLDEALPRVASWPYPSAQGQHLQGAEDEDLRAVPPGPRHAQRMFVLQAQWLDETLSNARRVLHAQDPFLQALQSQRDAAPPVAVAFVSW